MPRSTSLCLISLLLLFAPSLAAAAGVFVEAERASVRTTGADLGNGYWRLSRQGRVAQFMRVTAGSYRVQARAYGAPAGGVWPLMGLMVDGRAVRAIAIPSATSAQYEFTAGLAAGIHEIGIGFLNEATVAKQVRSLSVAWFRVLPPSGAPTPVLVSPSAAVAAAQQREQDILARCNEEIEKNRKSDAVLRVVDAAGKPLPGLFVHAEQIRHDFLFGCNLFAFDRFATPLANAMYKQRFAGLFNYATLPFYWQDYEPRQGQPDYASTDRAVAWCVQQGIRCKGHPLLWGDTPGIPPWSKGQPSAALQQRRITDILRRYQGKIAAWEVVNEPAHWAQPTIDQPYRWARQADPRATLIVNDYYVLADGRPQFLSLLSRAQRSGVPFDAVGIQAHEPRTMWFPLDGVWQIFNQYASLGKPLHLTEFTPVSSSETITGGFHQGRWDENTQADYAEKFYRVCFAHPAVAAVTWWDFCDQGAWLRGGGMLRSDLTPKPVYWRLRTLVQSEWRTDRSGVADPQGRFAFRGFHGTYSVLVNREGKTTRREFHLSKGKTNAWTFTLPADEPVAR